MLSYIFTVFILPIVILWFLMKEYTAYKNRKKSIKGRTVLMTGSANGFGKDICLTFAQEGCNLICVDIDEIGNKDTVKQCKEISNNIKVVEFTCDITDPEKVRELSKKVYEEFEHVDILYNNAGVAYPAPISSLSDQHIKRVMDVNVLAHFWMIRTFLPKMIERRRGLIIATASIASRIGVDSLAPYCASKFAVVGMMDSLMRELNVLNCRVRTLTVHPGFMATQLLPKRFRTPGLVWLKPYKPFYICDTKDAAREVIYAIKEKKTRLYYPYHYIIAINFLKYCLPQVVTDWLFLNVITIGEHLDPL